MNILIENGKVVNSDKSEFADVFISDGKILKVGKFSETEVPVPDRKINAKDMLVFPGGIDPHVHFKLPAGNGFTADDFVTGGKAALFGGTTTVIDFVTPSRNQSYLEALEQRFKDSDNCPVDFSFHMSPTWWGKDSAKEIKECLNEGISSFKIYMAYLSSIGIVDSDIEKVMSQIADYGGLLTAHCEVDERIEQLRRKFISEGKVSPEYHPLSRPPQVEEDAVRNLIRIAGGKNCPVYIVHVSSGGSVEIINQDRKRGQIVLGETCPQYFLLDDSAYSGNFNKASAFVMSPPLRPKLHQERIWDGIKNNLLQTVATDHCSFTLAQKRLGINDFTKIPNGAAGVENRMQLLYTYGVNSGKITLNEFVALTSRNAALIFGLGSSKGRIEQGFDADIVVWNPKPESVISANTHHHNSDITTWEDFKIIGAPVYTIRRGELMIENNKINPAISTGKFMKRDLPALSNWS